MTGEEQVLLGGPDCGGTRSVRPGPRHWPDGGGRSRAGDREALAPVIFMATSGCTWRQLPAPNRSCAAPRLAVAADVEGAGQVGVADSDEVRHVPAQEDSVDDASDGPQR